MGTVVEDELSAEAQDAVAGQEQHFTPDEIAALLDEWRPAVLREMAHRRLWQGASRPELEDQFQDVALVLWSRAYASEEHLRRALWTALGFRARDHWKSARRRELPVGEFFDEVIGDDRAVAVEDAAAAAADVRCVDDCLSELNERERSVFRLVKGDELSRRRVARSLGLAEAEVLRALYSAERKIDQVATLLMAGRLCNRRGPAVAALARSEARGVMLEQARAHLAHCPDCLLAFRQQRAAIGRRVASVLPAPAVATGHAPDRLSAIIEHIRDAPGALKRHLYELSGRTPSGSGEAVAGAGSMALGTKVAVGLCISAAAGGGAFCADQLSLFPGSSGSHRSSRTAAKHRDGKQRARPKATPAVVPQMTAQPPTSQPASDQRPPPSTSTPPASHETRHAQHEPPPEFFGGSSGTGAASTPTAKQAAQPPPAPTAAPSSSSARPSSGSGSGSGSGGGGGEFFGG